MVLFIILGVIVLVTLGVLGFLFYMLSKEGQKKEDAKAVPVTDLAQLKKELSPGLHDLPKSQTLEYEAQIIPPFEPKVSLPTQDVIAATEDNEYKKHAQELEEELEAISQKAERQLDGAKHLIETLSQENESLKAQQDSLEEAQQKLNEVQAEATSLKTENISLQTRLESTTAQVTLLEDQMAAVKVQMGEEISRANAMVSELNREKEALSAEPQTAPDQALLQEVETLRTEQIQLKEKYEELEKKHQQLEKDNEQLQYELVKARAQSSGLERVSFNYKNQLEDFLKKVSTAEASNEHLSQAKNRLEGMVEEIKLQNEELAKKDQLAQFELDKNRSRLVSLERECEDLKVRVQQNNQQV